MPRGGKRPGAGRPRGDRQSSAIGYRPRARDIASAATRGVPVATLIDEGLDALAAAEERRPDDRPLETILSALSKL